MLYCCQRKILLSDMQNSARFFQFHFTHYPPYQKDKIVLGTTKTSKEVVLEKLHWSLTQVRENGKPTNAIKSLISRHSKKWTHLVNGHVPRIIIHQSKSYVWLSKRRTPVCNLGIRIIFPVVAVNQSFNSRLKLV